MASSTFKNLSKHLVEQLESMGFTVVESEGSTSKGPIETARYEATHHSGPIAAKSLRRLAAIYKKLGFKLDHLHEDSLFIRKQDVRTDGYVEVIAWPVYQSETLCVLKASINVKVDN